MVWALYVEALVAILLVGAVGWAASLAKNDVSFVDSLWSLFFLLAAVVFAADTWPPGPRGWLVLALVAIWALRLSVYITARNWGQPEDHRYRTIRENNEPGFRYKSAGIVFGLQGVLAWIVALPLLPAITADAGLTPLDLTAAAIWLVGIVFEAVGDYQLARFRRDPANRGRVLDSGLWRYTRHPNYFGEFCIWWAFYGFAVAAGAWWAIVSPLLMTFLLLKVSGVSMLESTIGNRRPAYQAYARQTNAFVPGLPRRADELKEAGA
jgi:steroid 5-alpha reductase family enzyme